MMLLEINIFQEILSTAIISNLHLPTSNQHEHYRLLAHG